MYGIVFTPPDYVRTSPERMSRCENNWTNWLWDKKEMCENWSPPITNSFLATNPVRCLVGSVVTRKSRVCRLAELWHAMVEMESGGSQRIPPLFCEMVWGIVHTRARCMSWQRITFYTPSTRWTGQETPNTLERICGYVWLVVKDVRHVTKTARWTLTY